MAALLREVAFDSGQTDDAKLGWGAFIAGSYALTPSTKIRAQLTGGDGIGAYMKVNPAPAAYRAGQHLDTIFAWGGTLGISQEIGSGTFNVAYSRVEADWQEAKRAGVSLVKRTDRGQFIEAYDEVHELIHVNYLWHPIDQVTYGIELSHAMRETVDHQSGEVTRIQGSVIYAF